MFCLGRMDGLNDDGVTNGGVLLGGTVEDPGAVGE